MNSTSLIPLVLRRSHQLGRLTSCRQCWLQKYRLLAQPSRAPVVSVFSRYVSTGQAEEESRSTGGLWNKIKFDLGFITGLKYSKSVLNVSGFRMYVCCTELINHQHFFKEFNLPDTFNSWFLVTELHIWLCMVRLSDLGKDGRLLRNNLVKALWEDVEGRSKQLGEAASLTARKEGVRQLADVFHASLFAFDEGLLGDDKALASAVWRIMFEMRPDIEPAHLEAMVAYIRKQVAHVDQQPADTILARGFVSFLPLKGDSVDTEAAERQTLVIGKLRTKV